MGGQTHSNGRSKSKRPLTTLIEKEADIIADSDAEMNPNFAGRLSDSDAVIQNLKQQLDSLQHQIAFLTENGMGGDAQSASEADEASAEDTAKPKVERNDLSRQAEDASDESQDEDEDQGHMEAIFESARDKIGSYLDPEAVTAQLNDLRDQVASMSSRIPVDRSKLRSFKNDVVAPAVSAALPAGIGTLGETAVRKITLDTVTRYGIPTAILLAAIKLSSSKGKERTQ